MKNVLLLALTGLLGTVAGAEPPQPLEGLPLQSAELASPSFASERGLLESELDTGLTLQLLAGSNLLAISRQDWLLVVEASPETAPASFDRTQFPESNAWQWQLRLHLRF